MGNKNLEGKVKKALLKNQITESNIGYNTSYGEKIIIYKMFLDIEGGTITRCSDVF